MHKHKIHYGDSERLDVEYIEILNDEGLHTTAKLCDGRHSKKLLPDPTFDKTIVTCKKCLNKLRS